MNIQRKELTYYLFCRAVLKYLLPSEEDKEKTTHQNIQLERVLCSPFMTALEMQGISISVLKATDETLALLDQPVGKNLGWNSLYHSTTPPSNKDTTTRSPPSLLTRDPKTHSPPSEECLLVCSIAEKLAETLITHEQELTLLDQEAGCFCYFSLVYLYLTFFFNL